jgi:hypothetical protein
VIVDGVAQCPVPVFNWAAIAELSSMHARLGTGSVKANVFFLLSTETKIILEL